MFKHISKLWFKHKKNCLKIRNQLSLTVFITAKIVTLLSSKNDNKKDNNNKEVFLNKSVTTSKNKNDKNYVLNVFKMS